MTRGNVQYSIDGSPVTKKEFLRRRDKEVREVYVQQQHLIKNKVFSLGQIRKYEKLGLLASVRHKGKKCFKREDALALVEEKSGAKNKVRQMYLLKPSRGHHINVRRKIYNSVMKSFRVLAQPLSGEEEKREYFVDAEDEETAKKLAYDKMLAREGDDALLDSPAQIFTADEITFNPRKISDLIDNIEYYVTKMRKMEDMDVIPEMLKQYAQNYFRDVPLDEEAVRALALFTMDKTYRVAAYLEIVDNYTRAYFAKVIPYFWDYLHNKGLGVFYIVDNTFRNDGRFEAITELFSLTGITVIAPYDEKGVLEYGIVESRIKERMAERKITMYIEKDSRVNYLEQVKDLATKSNYLCIFRSKASASHLVEVLKNHS